MARSIGLEVIVPNVGAELASVPFGKMIFDMASAIARTQTALDMASINLVQVLASTTFDYVPDVVETLSPQPRQVQVMVSGVPQGLTDAHNNPVMVTGVHMDCDVAPSFPLTLLQAGVNPTFYQFTNSTIVVKMSVTSTTDTTDAITVNNQSQASGDFLFSSGSMTSHVNASYSGKYSYSAEGSSSLSTTLACVPPPKSIMPRFILVNAMNSANIQVVQS
jgi:hypothetical protein